MIVKGQSIIFHCYTEGGIQLKQKRNWEKTRLISIDHFSSLNRQFNLVLNQI